MVTMNKWQVIVTHQGNRWYWQANLFPAHRTTLPIKSKTSLIPRRTQESATNAARRAVKRQRIAFAQIVYEVV